MPYTQFNQAIPICMLDIAGHHQYGQGVDVRSWRSPCEGTSARDLLIIAYVEDFEQEVASFAAPNTLFRPSYIYERPDLQQRGEGSFC